jgi:hypothetical protein
MATNPVSRAALSGLYGVDSEGWDRHQAHSRGERQFTKNFDQVGPYGTVGKNLGKDKTGMTPGQVPGVSRAQGQRDKMANFMSQMPAENQLNPGKVESLATAGQLHNLAQAVKGSGKSKFGYKGSWDRNMQDIAAIQQQMEDAVVTLAGNQGIYSDPDPSSRDMGTMSVMGASGVRGAAPHFGMTAIAPGHIGARSRSRSRTEKDDEDPYSAHTKAMNPTAVTGFKGLLGLPGRAAAATSTPRAASTPASAPAPAAAPARAAPRDDGVSDHDPYGHKAAAEAASARKSSMARAAKARASKKSGGGGKGKAPGGAPKGGHHKGLSFGGGGKSKGGAPRGGHHAGLSFGGGGDGGDSYGGGDGGSGAGGWT